MGIRSTIAGFVLEGTIRDMVEQALSARTFVTPGELQTVKQDLAKVGGGSTSGSDVEEKLAALEKRIAALEKKQSMTMGAVQAGTASIMTAKSSAESAQSSAAQAAQIATSAQATAEAAVDGVTGVEERIDALIERLGSAPAPAKAAPKKKGKSKAAAADKGCKVEGCSGSHRARGFCGKHYQMFKRGTLEGFPNN